MVPRTAFLVEKAISLPLIAAAVIFLSSTQMLAAFIVFGVGHFFVAYLYQCRAKKYARASIGLAASALLVALAALMHFSRIDVLIVVTGAAFLVHFLLDEAFLSGEKAAPLRALEMLPILLLYVGTLLKTVMHVQILLELGLAAVAILVFYAASMLRARRRPDLVGTYFLCIAALLLFLTVSKTYVPLQVLIGSLVLLHYTSWYVAYYLKVRGNPARARSYLLSVLVVNAIVFACYWLFLKLGTRSVFAYLFLPTYFYVWTLVHTIVSIRRSDWEGLIAGAER